MPAVGVGIQVEEEVICLSGILRRRVMIRREERLWPPELVVRW